MSFAYTMAQQLTLVSDPLGLAGRRSRVLSFRSHVSPAHFPPVVYIKVITRDVLPFLRFRQENRAPDDGGVNYCRGHDEGGPCTCPLSRREASEDKELLLWHGRCERQRLGQTGHIVRVMKRRACCWLFFRSPRGARRLTEAVGVH